jgi:hypothetical protein
MQNISTSEIQSGHRRAGKDSSVYVNNLIKKIAGSVYHYEAVILV